MNTPFISYFLQMPSTPPYKCLTLQCLVLLTSDCFPGNTRHSLPYVCDTQLVENSLIVFRGKITSGQSRLVLIVLTLRRARAHPLDSSVLVKALCKNKNPQCSWPQHYRYICTVYWVHLIQIKVNLLYLITGKILRDCRMFGSSNHWFKLSHSCI